MQESKKIEVIRAKKMGFCFGVQEAIESCVREVEGIKQGRDVYILGMLVHNQYVVEAMEKQGLQTISEDSVMRDEAQLKKGDLVIVRAHGTTKQIYDKLKKMEVEIKDATCIFVKSIRQSLVKLQKEKKKIMFIGDKNHPEVVGILSFGDDILVFSGLEELEKRKDEIKKEESYSLLTQTTLNKKKMEEIKKYLENNHLNVTIYSKICSATQERQEAVQELGGEVDMVLIVGGKNSSNTQKLYEISHEVNSNTKLIENEEDLDLSWFSHGMKVGISAGASTPEELIIKIENKLRGL